MIFLISVIFTVLGIVVTVIMASSFEQKYDGKNKLVKFISDFFYYNDEIIAWISKIISFLCGFVTINLLLVIIVAQIGADAARAKNEQRYEALIYKVQTESIRDDFGIINKEYIDEVQSWNEDVAEYQAYSNSFWIGIFYPARVYDGLEMINLEDIKIRE